MGDINESLETLWSESKKKPRLTEEDEKILIKGGVSEEEVARKKVFGLTLKDEAILIRGGVNPKDVASKNLSKLESFQKEASEELKKNPSKIVDETIQEGYLKKFFDDFKTTAKNTIIPGLGSKVNQEMEEVEEKKYNQEVMKKNIQNYMLFLRKQLEIQYGEKFADEMIKDVTDMIEMYMLNEFSSVYKKFEDSKVLAEKNIRKKVEQGMIADLVTKHGLIFAGLGVAFTGFTLFSSLPVFQSGISNTIMSSISNMVAEKSFENLVFSPILIGAAITALIRAVMPENTENQRAVRTMTTMAVAGLGVILTFAGVNYKQFLAKGMAGMVHAIPILNEIMLIMNYVMPIFTELFEVVKPFGNEILDATLFAALALIGYTLKEKHDMAIDPEKDKINKNGIVEFSEKFHKEASKAFIERLSNNLVIDYVKSVIGSKEFNLSVNNQDFTSTSKTSIKDVESVKKLLKNAGFKDDEIKNGIDPSSEANKAKIIKYIQTQKEHNFLDKASKIIVLDNLKNIQNRNDKTDISQKYRDITSLHAENPKAKDVQDMEKNFSQIGKKIDAACADFEKSFKTDSDKYKKSDEFQELRKNFIKEQEEKAKKENGNEIMA